MKDQGEEVNIQMSFMEIYNEKVYDLLMPNDQDLQIREDPNRTIFVSNLAQVWLSIFSFFFSFFCGFLTPPPPNTSSLSQNWRTSQRYIIQALKIEAQRQLL